MDLHEKTGAYQALDRLCGFAVFLVGRRQLLDLVEYGIQLTLIGQDLEDGKQQKHQVLGWIREVESGPQRLKILECGAARVKLRNSSDFRMRQHMAFIIKLILLNLILTTNFLTTLLTDQLAGHNRTPSLLERLPLLTFQHRQ